MDATTGRAVVSAARTISELASESQVATKFVEVGSKLAEEAMAAVGKGRRQITESAVPCRTNLCW